jgi:hypothetical protein
MRRRLFPVLFSSGPSTPVEVYLFRDEFTTDDDAPITSPRTAEPGPGAFAITDTGSKMGISFDGMQWDRQTTANALRWLTSETYPRACGLALSAFVSLVNRGDTHTDLMWSANNSATLAGADIQIGTFPYNGTFQTRIGSAFFNLGTNYYYNTRFYLVLRDTGSWLISDDKLLWVDDASSGANLYAGAYIRDFTGAYRGLAIKQLGDSFTTQYGFATSHTASAAANATLTHDANGHVKLTWTPGAAETLQVDFRKTNDSNLWKIVCDQAAGTIKLYKREAASDTEVDTGKTQTWSVGTPYRITIWMDGATIRTFVNNVAKHAYTTATFNQSATGAKTSLAVADFDAWAMTLSAELVTELTTKIPTTTPFTRTGVVLSSGGCQEPTVIRETGPVVLADTGQTVFKMWYTVGNTNINYAESNDGETWTNYTSNPVITSHGRNSVCKVGSTYYLYCNNFGNNNDTIDLYTSADGVTFALDTAAVLSVGAAVAWDDAQLGNCHVWQEAADSFKMIYDATGGGGNWRMGLATSTDGRAWTKSASNPVLVSTAGMIGGAWIVRDGASYIAWLHYAMDGNLPTDAARYVSTDLVTWTPYPLGSLHWRMTADEGHHYRGQIADCCILQVGDEAYLYYTATLDGSNSFVIKLAKAPSSIIVGDWT